MKHYISTSITGKKTKQKVFNFSLVEEASTALLLPINLGKCGEIDSGYYQFTCWGSDLLSIAKLGSACGLTDGFEELPVLK